jgi:ParB-like chromosome segregation protein Spo0J
LTEGQKWFNTDRMRVHIEKQDDRYYCGFRRQPKHTRAPEEQPANCEACWNGYMNVHSRSILDDSAKLRVLQSVPISQIKVSTRFRKDLGDIESFARNVKQVGLLQPPVLTPDLQLVAGQRRIEAYKKLGLKEIPVLIEKVSDPTLAQYYENSERKQFTFEEEMKIADALEPQFKKLAQDRQKAHGGTAPGKHSAQIAPSERVSEQLAKGFNEGSRTFEKKREIWRAIKSGHPKAAKLRTILEKRGVSSASAVLKIYERRQKLAEQINKDAKNREALPTTIRFGDYRKLIRELKPKSVDSVVTSPPFDAGIPFYGELLRELERVTIDYALIFWSSTELIQICQHFGNTMATRPLIWDKQIVQEPFRYEPIFIHKFGTERFNINSRINHDVLHHSPPQSLASEGRMHIFENPPRLYEELIELTSAQVILDPFLGSGTTYKVCKKLGKTCIGFEQDASHRDTIMMPLIIKERQGS